jgi:hypothetical protein
LKIFVSWDVTLPLVKWLRPFWRIMVSLSSWSSSPRITLEIKAPWSIKMPGNAHPLTQLHIPEDLNF